jgi:septal ring factor EnvC (AmiA/AmiB activator)
VSILWGLIEFISLVALIVGLFMRFSKKNREDIQKKKQGRNIAIIGAIALFASGLIMSNVQGNQVNKAKIEGKTVTYKQLVKKIAAAKATHSKLSDQNNKLKDDQLGIQTEISSLKDQHKGVMQAIKNKKKLNDQVSEAKDNLSSVKSDISDAKDELKSVNEKVASTNADLAKAKGQVAAAKGAPKTFQAGKYTIGKDLKSGRYKATPVGSGSNFVVYEGGADGPASVNTILGSNGEPSYTFECADGDVMQTEASVKLTPIK